jgi:hypothetical protein
MAARRHGNSGGSSGGSAPHEVSSRESLLAASRHHTAL